MMTKSILVLLCLWLLAGAQEIKPNIVIVSQQMLEKPSKGIVYSGGKLNYEYNAQVLEDGLSCRNGNLQIINNTNGETLLFKYEGMPALAGSDLTVDVTPHHSPHPEVSLANDTHFELTFHCCSECTQHDFYNLIKVDAQGYRFSFLLNCDPGERHKTFEYGYLLLSLINGAIIVGVAMHSHVWSIRIDLRPLRYNLKWPAFLGVSIIAVMGVVTMSLLAIRDFQYAFIPLQFFGIVISIFFVFLCFNEIFYIHKKLRRPLFKFIRFCDSLSVFFTAGLTTLAFFEENWILYNLIAGCICVGSIKTFHFRSLKQAYISMFILTATTTSLTIALHFVLPRSYNDYAGELSSPLFLEVPAMVHNLYKKCSWLPVFDVIIPGVTLSYLRLYDENRSSRWGGIYTVSCNLAFIISTILWTVCELIYPFSVPFSLVTYTCLMLFIFVLAWKRNDWDTLFYGTFEQGYDLVDQRALQEFKRSFSSIVGDDAMESTLFEQDEDRNQGSSIISD